MIAIINRLPVKEGMVGPVVERFTGGRGHVQGFPGFVSMEVLGSEEANEVLVITRWQNREDFDSWVGSEAFREAHARGGGGEMMRAHPEMSSYEVAHLREASPEASSEAPSGL